jgi:hypothetical protein
MKLDNHIFCQYLIVFLYYTTFAIDDVTYTKRALLYYYEIEWIYLRIVRC